MTVFLGKIRFHTVGDDVITGQFQNHIGRNRFPQSSDQLIAELVRVLRVRVQLNDFAVLPVRSGHKNRERLAAADDRQVAVIDLQLDGLAGDRNGGKHALTDLKGQIGKVVVADPDMTFQKTGFRMGCDPFEDFIQVAESGFVIHLLVIDPCLQVVGFRLIIQTSRHLESFQHGPRRGEVLRQDQQFDETELCQSAGGSLFVALVPGKRFVFDLRGRIGFPVTIDVALAQCQLCSFHRSESIFFHPQGLGKIQTFLEQTALTTLFNGPDNEIEIEFFPASGEDIQFSADMTPSLQCVALALHLLRKEQVVCSITFVYGYDSGDCASDFCDLTVECSLQTGVVLAVPFGRDREVHVLDLLGSLFIQFCTRTVHDVSGPSGACIIFMADCHSHDSSIDPFELTGFKNVRQSIFFDEFSSDTAVVIPGGHNVAGSVRLGKQLHDLNCLCLLFRRGFLLIRVGDPVEMPHQAPGRNNILQVLRRVFLEDRNKGLFQEVQTHLDREIVADRIERRIDGADLTQVGAFADHADIDIHHFLLLIRRSEPEDSGFRSIFRVIVLIRLFRHSLEQSDIETCGHSIFRREFFTIEFVAHVPHDKVRCDPAIAAFQHGFHLLGSECGREAAVSHGTEEVLQAEIAIESAVIALERVHIRCFRMTAFRRPVEVVGIIEPVVAGGNDGGQHDINHLIISTATAFGVLIHGNTAGEQFIGDLTAAGQFRSPGKDEFLCLRIVVPGITSVIFKHIQCQFILCGCSKFVALGQRCLADLGEGNGSCVQFCGFITAEGETLGSRSISGISACVFLQLQIGDLGVLGIALLVKTVKNRIHLGGCALKHDHTVEHIRCRIGGQFCRADHVCHVFRIVVGEKHHVPGCVDKLSVALRAGESPCDPCFTEGIGRIFGIAEVSVNDPALLSGNMGRFTGHVIDHICRCIFTEGNTERLNFAFFRQSVVICVFTTGNDLVEFRVTVVHVSTAGIGSLGISSQELTKHFRGNDFREDFGLALDEPEELSVRTDGSGGIFRQEVGHEKHHFLAESQLRFIRLTAVKLLVDHIEEQRIRFRHVAPCLDHVLRHEIAVHIAHVGFADEVIDRVFAPGSIQIQRGFQRRIAENFHCTLRCGRLEIVALIIDCIQRFVQNAGVFNKSFRTDNKCQQFDHGLEVAAIQIMTHRPVDGGSNRIFPFKAGTGNQHVHIGTALAGIGNRLGQTGLDFRILVLFLNVGKITGNRHLFITIQFCDLCRFKHDFAVLGTDPLQQGRCLLRCCDRIPEFHVCIHGNAQSNGRSIRFLDFFLQQLKARLVVFRSV